MHHPVTSWIVGVTVLGVMILHKSDIYSNVLSTPSKTFYFVFSCPEKMSTSKQDRSSEENARSDSNESRSAH